VFDWKLSDGHAAIVPVQLSATSQIPADARHTVPTPASASTNARPATAPDGVQPLCSGGLNEPVSVQELVGTLILMRPRPPAPPLIVQPPYVLLPPAAPAAVMLPLTVSDGAYRWITPPEPPPPAPEPVPPTSLPPLPPLARTAPEMVSAPVVAMRSAPPPPPPPPPPCQPQLLHWPPPPPPPEPG